MSEVTGHPATWGDAALLGECEATRQRRSGPGGQHRNKVETAVVLRHLPSGITGQASERRSQAENQAVALRRLRVNLALNFRCPPAPRPSATWRGRVINGRIQVNAAHADFPRMLAEVLDYLVPADHDLAAAAAHFDCTTSQLIKLFKRDALVFQWLNRQRRERGLHELK